MNSSTRKTGYYTDNWTTRDDLHFEDFRSALRDIILNADTPLTIGVFGTWGSGKTSLLQKLKEEIDQPKDPFIRTVWFTAWKYDRHDALRRAFILRVIDGLFPKVDGQRIPTGDLKDEAQRQQVEQLEKMLESLYRVVEWETKGGWSIDLAETIKEGVKLPPWLILRLAGLGDIAKDFGINPDLAKLIKREAEENRIEQLVSMEQFEQTFQDSIHLMLGEKGRLIVFVDDLDRCLPEKAIEVLEAIKLFLHVPQTIFVLGMDREVIERGVESHYRSFFYGQFAERMELPINGTVYLQKLVQIPFLLPPIGVKDMDNYMQKLEADQKGDTRLSETTRKVFARGVFPNPRQVKRALNIFRLLKAVATAREERGDLSVEMIAWPLLAKTVLIQSQWSDLYTLWRLFPTLVQTLEEEYLRQPTSEEELIRGQRARRSAQKEGIPEEPLSEATPAPVPPASGGLLTPYLSDRQKYALLAQMLTFPDEPGKGRERALFTGLNREQMNAYLSLAGAVAQVEVISQPAETPGDLLSEFLSGDTVRINDAFSRLEALERERGGSLDLRQTLQRELVSGMQESSRLPIQRATIGDALDRLGWLPSDLYHYIPVPIEENPKFYIAQYQVTNVQYERFIQAKDYMLEQLWQNFPKFDEKGQPIKEDWGNKALEWINNVPDYRKRSESELLVPAYWHDQQIGIARKAVPVAGVSWYEANAYCQWLQRHWTELEEGRENPRLKPAIIRLPTETEWAAAAGGETPENRYPWDKDKEATNDEGGILLRANVSESGIGRTTPVGMYPLGVSSSGVWDLGGNVWEWQANFWSGTSGIPSLRGGGWSDVVERARVSARSNLNPSRSLNNIGFRVVALIN